MPVRRSLREPTVLGGLGPTTTMAIAGVVFSFGPTARAIRALDAQAA